MFLLYTLLIKWLAFSLNSTRQSFNATSIVVHESLLVFLVMPPFLSFQVYPNVNLIDLRVILLNTYKNGGICPFSNFLFVRIFSFSRTSDIATKRPFSYLSPPDLTKATAIIKSLWLLKPRYTCIKWMKRKTLNWTRVTSLWSSCKRMSLIKPPEWKQRC